MYTTPSLLKLRLNVVEATEVQPQSVSNVGAAHEVMTMAGGWDMERPAGI